MSKIEYSINLEKKFMISIEAKWPTKRLDEVAEINPSKSAISSLSDDLPVSFVPMKAVDGTLGVILDRNVRPLGEIRKGYKYFQEGDVIFARITPCLENGKCAIAENLENEIGLGSTEFLVVRSSSMVLKEWVFYFLRQESVRKQAQRYYSGTVGQQRVQQEFLENQIIPVPTISAQKNIISLIRSSHIRTYNSKQDLSRIPDLTRRLRMAILSRAFLGELTGQNPNDVPIENLLEKITDNDSVGKLYTECGKKWTSRGLRKEPIDKSELQELPVGWEYIELGRWIYIAGRIGWRGLKAKEYTKEGPLFLSVYNLNKGEIVDLSESYHISPERYDESPEIKLRNDDILLTKDGAGIGKIGIVKGLDVPATVNSSLLVIRGGDLFFPEYLFYLLKGPEMQKVVSERITGSATPHLFQRDIRNFILPVPPYEEQVRTVNVIKPIMILIESLEKQSEAIVAKLAQLEQSTLNKAFSGELIPQDTLSMTEKQDKPSRKSVQTALDEFANN